VAQVQKAEFQLVLELALGYLASDHGGVEGRKSCEWGASSGGWQQSREQQQSRAPIPRRSQLNQPMKIA
jgi:hypothetical protein